MSLMFSGSKFNQPIGNWNVSNVIEMNAMFATSDFNQPIGNWNVSKVKNMWKMFHSSKFNQPINNWNVKKVKNMDEMFVNSSMEIHNFSEWKTRFHNQPVVINMVHEFRHHNVTPKKSANGGKKYTVKKRHK